jgi:hypothetical protein
VTRDLERDPATRAVIKAIEGMKGRLGAPPSELPNCKRAAAPPAARATAIDGVWRMDTDARAAGAEGYDENWGHWTFVLDRGRFADTQENKRSCTWGYGRLALHGNRMLQRLPRHPDPDAGQGQGLPGELPHEAMAPDLGQAVAELFQQALPAARGGAARLRRGPAHEAFKL